MFEFINRAIKTCQTRLKKEAPSPSSPDPCQVLAAPELLLSMEQAIALSERTRQQILADAHAAAASGEGPQTWDRDWYEHQMCIEDDISDIATTIGWHRTQDFLEVLDWALASPQGQRALAEAGDDASPWQGALEMIKDLRAALIEATHQMLFSRADGLGYSIDAKEEVWEALKDLPRSLDHMTRNDG
jgi:hypothetical protein